ncbi:MAG: S24 family peptidase [Calditrichaceae bacterium]
MRGAQRAENSDLNSEFYNIPLLGEVRMENNFHTSGNYNIGEIISNFKKDDTRSITLKAIDNGLSNTGILSGDFLTVNLTPHLRNGDISVIKLGHRIYVRKIYFDKHLIRLETADASVSPLIVDPRTPDFELIGKVVTVIREL